MEILLVYFNVTLPIYRGTVIDGEMVDNSVFMMFDCLRSCSWDTKTIKFNHRLELLFRLSQLIRPSTKSKIKLKCKQFVPLRSLPKYLNTWNFDHKSDGLIFTHNSRPVSLYTDYYTFKWKPPVSLTIDFFVDHKDDRLHFFVEDNSKPVLHATQEYTSDFTGSGVWECSYHAQKQCWTLVRLRSDKSVPNSLYVLKHTVQTFLDNLSIQVLCDFLFPGKKIKYPSCLNKD